MSPRHTLIRRLHDLGLSAWFGGSQRAIPTITGALVVLGAQQGEQQRPGQRIRSGLPVA